MARSAFDGEDLEESEHARGKPEDRREIAEQLGDVHHCGVLSGDPAGLRTIENGRRTIVRAMCLRQGPTDQ